MKKKKSSIKKLSLASLLKKMEDLKTILFNKQYMLKRRISSGSFGVVFRGIDTTSNKIVALKLEELKKKEDEIRSVQREGSFLKRLEGV